MSKSEFGSDGSVSAVRGASGGNDEPPKGGAIPTVKMVRSRAQIQDIVPCCVNQLLTSTLADNVFKIRGIEVSQVSIVGIIRQAERVPNSILYKIDDMTTKPIEARQWLGRDKSKQLTPLPVGLYAKVLGVLKCSAEGVKSLEVLTIRALEDMNEVTVHILDTVNAHMILDKARRATAGESSPVAQPAVGDAKEHKEGCLSYIQEEVLRLIHECPQQEGKSVCELQAQLCGLSAEAIIQAIEYLTVKGYIYPTVDQAHFKSAD
ncbi:PREDICTED: replication protein A 30 kDa subunit [Galeopterus variegatus]|uniref:Replication protein A 30 kDa subunit n=1 Tax=Galeopterus variegatus TaxID=482537 RepID=A0ABM0R586_GALVR|nr:PREDICTED: replication protein A 30 kDa subunit [Galeopterus variegatus]